MGVYVFVMNLLSSLKSNIYFLFFFLFQSGNNCEKIFKNIKSHSSPLSGVAQWVEH